VTALYILLDSDVLSFFLSRDPEAKLYEADIKGKIPVITFQTRGELLRWPIERRWGADRIARLKQNLGNYPVIESGNELSQKWAEVRAHGRLHGWTIGDGDVWIGAAALLYDIPLATHNRRHFDWMKALGLRLICHAPESE
jgi:predicted nucleic acid-binding protein